MVPSVTETEEIEMAVMVVDHAKTIHEREDTKAAATKRILES